MKIGFLGYKFENENLGCVALTYATIDILHDIFKDNLTIVNITDVHEDMSFARKYFPEIKFIEQMYTMKGRLMKLDRCTKEQITSCDAVLDITFGDNFSDIYLPKFVQRTTHMKLCVERLGVPLLLMPQTIGPFRSKPLLLQALLAIAKSKRVYSRDVLSSEFVHKYLKKKDVYVTTDLALALPFDKRQKVKSSKIRVGLNVSGLLWKGGFHTQNQFGLKVDYISYIETLINKLLKEDKYEIHIIPHVTDVSVNAQDGDLACVEYLKHKFPKLIFAPTYTSPIDVKTYISTMDVFSGARMHSTVAAFSSEVATIPFRIYI